MISDQSTIYEFAYQKMRMHWWRNFVEWSLGYWESVLYSFKPVSAHLLIKGFNL